MVRIRICIWRELGQWLNQIIRCTPQRKQTTQMNKSIQWNSSTGKGPRAKESYSGMGRNHRGNGHGWARGENMEKKWRECREIPNVAGEPQKCRLKAGTTRGGGWGESNVGERGRARSGWSSVMAADRQFFMVLLPGIPDTKRKRSLKDNNQAREEGQSELWPHANGTAWGRHCDGDDAAAGREK